MPRKVSKCPGCLKMLDTRHNVSKCMNTTLRRDKIEHLIKHDCDTAMQAKYMDELVKPKGFDPLAEETTTMNRAEWILTEVKKMEDLKGLATWFHYAGPAGKLKLFQDLGYQLRIHPLRCRCHRPLQQCEAPDKQYVDFFNNTDDVIEEEIIDDRGNEHTHMHAIVALKSQKQVAQFNMALSKLMKQHNASGPRTHQIFKRITDHRHMVHTVLYMMRADAQSPTHEHYGHTLSKSDWLIHNLYDLYQAKSDLMRASATLRMETMQYNVTKMVDITEMSKDPQHIRKKGLMVTRLPRWAREIGGRCGWEYDKIRTFVERELNVDIVTGGNVEFWDASVVTNMLGKHFDE